MVVLLVGARSRRAGMALASIYACIYQMGMAMNGLLVPLYTDSLEVGILAVGVVSSGRLLASTFLGMPLGLISDRLGRNVTLIISSSIAVVMSIALSVSKGPIQIFVAWAFMGFSLSTFRPSIMALVSEVAGGKKMATAYGVFNTIESVGVSLGPLIAGIAVSAWSFQAAFLLSGAVFGICLLMAPLMGGMAPQTRQRESSRQSIRDLQLTGMAAGLVAVAGVSFVNGVTRVFVPLYGRQINLSVIEVGLVLAIGEAGGAVTRTPLGLLSDRFSRRLVTVLIGMVVSALSMLALTFHPSFGYLASLLVVQGAGVALIFVAARAYIVEVSGMRHLGLTMGMFSSCVNAGYTVGPPLSGLVISAYSFAEGFYATGLIALGITGAVYLLGKLSSHKAS